MEDLKILEKSETKEDFNFCWQLIKNDWSKHEILKDYIKIFEENNIIKNCNWFVGAFNIGMDNTNNAIEGFNNSFKTHFT